MSNSFFSSIETWRIPESALVDSMAEMAIDGISGNEGVALWLGHRRDGIAEVTHLVALRGAGIIKFPDFLRIESWLLNEVTDLAIDLELCLIGQIHSHGFGYPTDLSETDRTFGLAVPYFLSVVAPDYGLRSSIFLPDCGVHIFEPRTGFRRLDEAEVSQRILVFPGDRLPLHTVGDGS